MPTTLRLGTRASLLARSQSSLVAAQLMRLHPGLQVHLVFVKTTGDRIHDKPLADIGGKGLFTKELELALLNNEIDFAVHSFKDVPVTMPLVDQSDLIITSIPQREDPRDVAALQDPSLAPLFTPPDPRSAIQSQIANRKSQIENPSSPPSDLHPLTSPSPHYFATSSLRRRAQLLALFPSAQIDPLRGNIDTRLRKLKEGPYHAIILALAGLKRANLFDPTYMIPLDPSIMLPAPAQGALALQCRRADQPTIDLLQPLHHPATATCVSAERALVQALNGDCHSPIAALATIHDNQLTLRATIAHRNGHPPLLHAQASSPLHTPQQATTLVLQSLLSQNALQALHPPH